MFVAPIVPLFASPACGDAALRTLDETLATPMAGDATPAQVGASSDAGAVVPAGATDAPIEAATTAFKPRFGEMDSLRLSFLLGYGNDFDETQFVNGGIGLSWFFVDNVSLDVEFTGLGIKQPGDDAGAGDVSLLFRWHFLVRERWTLYVEGGAGLLWASQDVPPDGTSFNFTPQVGLGATYDLGNDVRLMVGARWFHISNARLSDNNPGLDSVMAYVGVSLPL